MRKSLPNFAIPQPITKHQTSIISSVRRLPGPFPESPLPATLLISLLPSLWPLRSLRPLRPLLLSFPWLGGVPLPLHPELRGLRTGLSPSLDGLTAHDLDALSCPCVLDLKWSVIKRSA